jgi:hypothetical protein
MLQALYMFHNNNRVQTIVVPPQAHDPGTQSATATTHV